MYITAFDSFNLSNDALIDDEGLGDTVHQFEEVKFNELSFRETQTEGVPYLKSSYDSVDGCQGNYEENNHYISEVEPDNSLESINRRCLRTAFERWRRKLRLKQLEKESYDEILSREYYRTKAEYQLQQKICIATVHFKIGILSDCFHKWRLFTIAMHVKRRRQEVARVHYGDHLTGQYFNIWKESFKEKCCQQKKINVFIMARTLKSWKRWTSLSIECNKQKYEYAVEHYNLVLLKSSYKKWRQDVLLTKAQAYYEAHHKMRVFKVWSLQLLKRKLQRRLARSYRRRLVQQRFFTKWKSKRDDNITTRILFSRKLELFVLRYYWERLRRGIEEETILRASAASINSLCKKNFVQYYFSLWKQQYRIECFKMQTEKKNCEYILRIHFERWKKERKKLLLCRKMDLWNNIQGKLISLEFFSRWQHQKQKRVHKNKEYEEYITIIDQNKVARSFATWKHRANEECTIKSFIQASERRVLTRCFNLWILVKRRGELLRMQEINILNRAFSYWREGAEQRIYTRRRKTEKDNCVLQKCVAKWKDYASLSKQSRETSVTCFARHWLDVTQQRVMNRKIEQAEKESCALIKKVHFAKWQHQFDAAVRRRLKLEGIAEKHHHCIVCLRVLNRWVRQQNITVIARNHQQEKAKVLLASSFKHWMDVIEQDMQSLINSFTEKLTLNNQNSLERSMSTSTLIQEENLSTQLSNSLSKTNDTLVNLYKESIENSLLEENDTLQLGSENKSTPRLNEFGSNSSLALAQKTEQSDFVSVSLPFSVSDTNNDFSSTAYNQELVDYNTDNDIDQDQIWEEPVQRSQLQLNFSSFSNVTSENNYFMQSNNFSFQPANVSIDNTNSPKWIYTWKKRYIHSKTLSHQKRYLHDDLITPSFSSLIPSLSGSIQNYRNVQLSLSGEDGTIPSRNVDNRKVSLLVATLNYWKHLDISAIFYAWLGYTQRKKYLRLMQEYLLEKKRHYRIHVVFLQWNRKLYGERAFSYFREKTMKNRYFCQWMKYHLFQQLKCSRLQDAQEQHRKSLVKSYFHEWKKKCHLEFLLSGINNSWNDDSALLLNNVIAVKEKKMLSNSFQTWKYSTLQMKLSKGHCDKVAQKRCLNTWCQFVKDKGHEREKLKEFHREHQLKRIFVMWKRKVHHKIQLHQAEMMKENEMKALIFSEWRKWTKSRLEDRLKEKFFKYKSNYQLLYDAFKEWELNYRQTISAAEHNNYVICRNVFSSWFDATGQMVTYENKMTSFQSKSSMQLVTHMFNLWKHMHESRLKAKNNKKQKEGNTLSITFKAWKETTLHSKADRKYVDNKCKHMFKSWKEKYVSRNEIQFLTKISCRRWKRLVQRAKENEVILQQYLEKRNLVTKRHYFVKWKEQFEQHLTIKRCERKDRLVRKIAIHWKLKTKEHILASIREKNSVKKYFLLWSKNYCQHKRAIEVHERHIKLSCLLHWVSSSRKKKEIKVKINAYIKIKGSQLINSVFVKWRLKTDYIGTQRLEEAQHEIAVEYYDQHLLKSLFYKWDVFVKQEKIKRIRHKRLACKYFEKWKNTVITGNTIVLLFRQNMLEKYWRRWRNMYIKNHVLKVMEKRDERRVLSLAFASWSRHTQLKRSLPNQMKLLRTATWFRKWRERCSH